MFYFALVRAWEQVSQGCPVAAEAVVYLLGA